MPDASNSRAYTLVEVKPGIVFSSFDEHLAVVADEHVGPRHSLAVGRDERTDGELLRALELLVA